MSTLTAIHIAASGLQAQQTAMEVAGHNIANVNTPGYHRQEVVLNAASRTPASLQESSANSPLGSGVEVSTIRRLQQQFLDRQQQRTASQVGYWDAMQTTLSQAERVLAPAADQGLSTQLDAFFAAWQQFADAPEEPVRRTQVVSSAVQLTATLNNNAAYLHRMDSELLSAEATRVQQLNDLATQLATLNGQIGKAGGAGIAANDLLDQRDQITRKMAGLAGVTVAMAADGTALVSLDGRLLVNGKTVHQVNLETGSGMPRLTWDDGAAAKITGGEIAGLETTHSTVLARFRTQYDAIAFALSSAVNSRHMSGVTSSGQPAGAFFTGATAGTLQVNADILADATNVAAGSTPNAPGDGAIARSIAGLANQPLIGTATVPQSAQVIVGQLGAAVRQAQTQADSHRAVQAQVMAQEQSVSGVSLDEELTNLLISQRAYDASARVLATADQMLQTLLQTLQ